MTVSTKFAKRMRVRSSVMATSDVGAFNAAPNIQRNTSPRNERERRRTSGVAPSATASRCSVAPTPQASAAIASTSWNICTPRNAKSMGACGGVACPMRAAHQASISAATPGSVSPSSISSEAPPPVETCVKRCSCRPSWATTAAVSPPPTTVVACELGKRPRHRERAFRELGHFEDAHRAVPDDGLRAREARGVRLRRLRADVEHHVAARHCPHGDGDGVRVGGEPVGGDDIDGHMQRRRPGASRSAMMRSATLTCSSSTSELRTSTPRGLEECVRHAAAEQRMSSFGRRLSIAANLGAHLGAADDRGERPRRVSDQSAEVADFLLHEETGHGGQVVRHALGRGVRAVGGAERVVDEHVRERGKLPREFRVVRLFLRMEAQVFEEQASSAAAMSPTASSATGPTQSSANRTSRSRRLPIRPATGASESEGRDPSGGPGGSRR